MEKERKSKTEPGPDEKYKTHTQADTARETSFIGNSSFAYVLAIGTSSTARLECANLTEEYSSAEASNRVTLVCFANDGKKKC